MARSKGHENCFPNYENRIVEKIWFSIRNQKVAIAKGYLAGAFLVPSTTLLFYNKNSTVNS